MCMGDCVALKIKNTINVKLTIAFRTRIIYKKIILKICIYQRKPLTHWVSGFFYWDLFL